MITRLDHIQIAMPVGGESKAREFYGRLLGLEEIDKPVELVKRGGCWFQAKHIQVHLGVEEDFRPAKKAHPGFCVDDLEKLKRAFENLEIEIKSDPATPDTLRFHVSDCFGNRLEFIQDGSGFSQ